MAKIVEVTNPVTGQPTQVDQLDHTAQQIDEAIAMALPGGALDITLQNKLGGIESTEYPGCYYRMVSGVVEWFNPPMILSKEYRTTERYLGKPVYTMMRPSVTLGSAGSTAYIEGLANIQDVIDYRIQFQNASSGKTFAVNNWGNKVSITMQYDSGYAYASIKCIEDCSGKIAIGTFKYTKTTG